MRDGTRMERREGGGQRDRGGERLHGTVFVSASSLGGTLVVLWSFWVDDGRVALLEDLLHQRVLHILVLRYTLFFHWGTHSTRQSRISKTQSFSAGYIDIKTEIMIIFLVVLGAIYVDDCSIF